MRKNSICRASLIGNLIWQPILRKMFSTLLVCTALLGTLAAEAQTITKSIPVTIQAEAYSGGAGVKEEASSDASGGSYVGSINAGDWMSYLNHKVIIPMTGLYVISYRVASPYNRSAFTFNNINSGGSVSKINRVVVPRTGGWQTWVTVQRTAILKAGPHYFGIKATVGGFNIDSFSITNIASGTTSSITASSSKSSVASSAAVSSAKSSTAVVKSSASSSSKAIVIDIDIGVGVGGVSSVPRVVSSSSLASSKISSSLASSSKLSLSSISSSKISSSSSKISSSAVSSSKVSSSKSSSSSVSSSAVSTSSLSSELPGYTQVSGPIGLTWVAPKLREDRSLLDITELGGYQLRYKSINDAKFTYITINDPWATTYNFSWLEGTYMFEIAAFDVLGVLSDFSSFTD